ncbi:AAA family ATPase [Nocardia fluminea]|uniref:AAA family ATPase n=1 Tax=Nocardia fluminea TaxID=134984 RepID=UPI0037AF988A
MVRITGARVKALLDDYDHEVEFPAEWPFVIIYGPNGVGKTKLLESVYYLSSQRFSLLSGIPFKWLEITYEDGVTVTAFKQSHLIDEMSEDHSAALIIELHDNAERRPVRFTYTANRSGIPSAFRHLIEAETTWEQIGPDRWRDARDGEIVSWLDLQNRPDFFELQRRYDLPSLTQLASNKEEVPRKLNARLSGSPVHFIETQRLVFNGPHTFGNSREDTISNYSDDMQTRLERAQANNSFQAQQIDRTFPQRILTSVGADSSEASIRAHYQRQNEQRKILADLGLVDVQPDLDLPDTEMAPWQRRVLQTYLNDTDERLGTFTHIVDRVTLFLEIINTRFTNKFVRASTRYGIEIVRRSDRKKIPPRDLSSGEQHELVLLYDLIFNVPQNALVLIDEPEISLHVAWQKSFTRDIERVAQLADLRFMIATHSPQIINKSWNRTAALGGYDAGSGEEY